MSSGDPGQLPPMWELPPDPAPDPAVPPEPAASEPPAPPEPAVPPEAAVTEAPAAEPPAPTAAPAAAPARDAPLPTYAPAQGFTPPAPDQVRLTAPTVPAPQVRLSTAAADTPATEPPAATPAAAPEETRAPPAAAAPPSVTPPPPAPPRAEPAAPAPAAPAPALSSPAASAPVASAPAVTPNPAAPAPASRPTVPPRQPPAPSASAPAQPEAPVATAPPAPAPPAPQAGSALAIDVRDLRVTYARRGRPTIEAVRGLTFNVREGEVLALLGPNGAGKTSTVEVLEGYREPTTGTVRVLGLDPASRAEGRTLREQIGIVLQQSEGEIYLTVAESVDRNAGYYPWPYDPDEVIEMVGLTEKADAQVRTLSGGQRRRLDLALGIIGGPRLLFLDEPTTGFDPSARRSSWELIRSLRELGTTIVLTTHYMDEAQALADRIIVIAKGVIVAEGTPESLGGRATADARIRFVVPPALDGTRVPVSPGDRAELDGFVVTVTTADPTRALHNLTGWALQRGARLESLAVERPTLEDVYLQLVGKEEGEQ